MREEAAGPVAAVAPADYHRVPPPAVMSATEAGTAAWAFDVAAAAAAEQHAATEMMCHSHPPLMNVRAPTMALHPAYSPVF